MTRQICPGCQQSELTYGRPLCQACKVSQLANSTPPAPPATGPRPHAARLAGQAGNPVTLITTQTPPPPAPAQEPADDRERLMRAAAALAGRGWHVFPCLPGGKWPALREDWERRATTDPARIARCWAAGPYNIGIACGPSRLIVIDLDKPKRGQQPPPRWAHVTGIRDGADVLAELCARACQPWPSDTYTVVTPSGGTHLYFTPPHGAALRNTAGDRGRGLGWLIDTRASGGYVLGPGSAIGGKPYATTHAVPPAPLPAWLADRLTAEPAPQPAGGPALSDDTHATGYALAALRGEVHRVLAAEPGTRNATLNEAAFALGQLTAAGILPEQLARDALMRAAHSISLPPREAARTIGSGLGSGARKPRSAA